MYCSEAHSSSAACCVPSVPRLSNMSSNKSSMNTNSSSNNGSQTSNGSGRGSNSGMFGGWFFSNSSGNSSQSSAGSSGNTGSGTGMGSSGKDMRNMNIWMPQSMWFVSAGRKFWANPPDFMKFRGIFRKHWTGNGNGIAWEGICEGKGHRDAELWSRMKKTQWYDIFSF